MQNTPTLKTQRLILRKFTQEDTQALFEILSDTEVNTFLPWFPPKNLVEAESFLQERFLAYSDKSFAYRYAICLREDNKPIGYVWLSNNDSNDFGYGLRREFWGQGIVTEASLAVIAQLKADGFPYITATHDKNNPASGAVMKKLGMTYQYSYVEQWQPKNITVTFRMYQLNFDAQKSRVYMEYWNNYPKHFKEEIL